MPGPSRVWYDSPAGGTPINATRLNGMEADIAAAKDRVFNVKDYGALCDGTTDDNAAVLAAATAAVAYGAPLFLPAGKTIGLASLLTLPAGLVLYTNGAKFKGLVENANFLISISSNTTIHGCLWVETVTGGTNVRGVSVNASVNVTIDALRVEAPAAGAGVGDPYDCALAVTGASDNINIRTITVKNFDYPVKFDGSSRIRVGALDISAYVRGLYINDTTDMVVQYGLIRTASPNALANPGHNGVLMSALANDSTTDIHLNNINVKDAGEHGFRIGGDKRVKRVWFRDCSAVNVGQAGFKVLGGQIADNNYHENIFFDNCIVEDAGQTAGNAAGFQLEFVRGVMVNSPIVRKNSKTYSAGHPDSGRGKCECP
jgi:hypothetical protein